MPAIIAGMREVGGAEEGVQVEGRTGVRGRSPRGGFAQIDKRAVRAGTTYRQERTHVRPHLMAYSRHVSAGHVIAARCRHGDDMSWSRVSSTGCRLHVGNVLL